MGDPFKVELYRVIVSLGVGFTAIFLFVFSFNLLDLYVYKHLNTQSQQHMINNQKQYVRSDSNPIQKNKNHVGFGLQDSNESTKDLNVDTQKQQISQDTSKNDGSGGYKNSQSFIELSVLDIERAAKETFVFIKEFILPLLLVSIIIGEFLSTLGIIIVTAPFEEPIDGSIKKVKIYVDKGVGYIEVKKLFHALNNNSGFLTPLSELHFALAKGFAGIYIAFVISSIMTGYTSLFLIYPKFDVFDMLIAYILFFHFLIHFFVIWFRYIPLKVDLAIMLLLSIIILLLSLIFKASLVSILFIALAVVYLVLRLLSIVMKQILLNPVDFIIYLTFHLTLLTFANITVSIFLFFIESDRQLQVNLSAVVHSFYVMFGIISFLIAVHNLRFANRMLYLILSEPKRYKKRH